MLIYVQIKELFSLNYDLTHAGKVVLFAEICEGGISSTYFLYEIIYVKTLF